MVVCYFEIKAQISNLVRASRFWNDLRHVRSESKDWKAKTFKSFSEQVNRRALQESQN